MDAFLQTVANGLSTQTLKMTTYAGEISILVNATELHGTLKLLRDNFGFDYLVDITAIDHFRDEQRFEISYNIYNLSANKRIRIKTFVEENLPEVESAVDIWPSANWLEREQWDMMGIRFRNHPDLRRIFMPEDFEYHPLRKEFPLIGIPGSIQMPEKDSAKGYR
jgi:NADH-quinone oxidoreductase subunit C